MFDFDNAPDRRSTGSYKWDFGHDAPADLLPLWVADMDFRTAPAIIDALRHRVDHGIFGYTYVGQEYYDAVTGWFARRHGWTIDRDSIIYTSGVVPAISAIIKAIAREDEMAREVIVMTPVYNCFFSSIRNNGCIPLQCSLKWNDCRYTIDFERLEEMASSARCRMLLLCNPHNPGGRVWMPDELRRVGEICGRHGVTIISDEIHCELVFAPFRYTPMAVASGDVDSLRMVCCISPSKAFNIAGLQIANIVCPNPELRARIDRAINDNEVCDVNPFGVVATIAAYRDGEPWLKALMEYIGDNHKYFSEFCKLKLPKLPIAKLEGTYLEWMDCRVLGMTSERLEEDLLDKEHLWLNAGSMYGADGEGFIRWNIACPHQRLKEALECFVSYIDNIQRY